MQRRKLLVGMGSLAAGSAAAIGTGATGSFTASGRQSSVDVVAEDSGVIAIEDTSSGDIVNQEDGELEIDLAEFDGGGSSVGSGSEGMPIGSVLRIGNYHANPRSGESGDPNDAAFQVQNQWAGSDVDLTLTFTPGDDFNVNRVGGNQSTSSQLIFEFEPIPGESGKNGGRLVVDDEFALGQAEKASASTTDKSFIPAMESGEAYGINVIINTDNPGSNTDENLSGTLSISADPVSN